MKQTIAMKTRYPRNANNKALLYLHTDTTEQRRDVRSNAQILRKRIECERKASELELLIVGEYVDIGTSAATLNRHGLQSCLHELEVGAVSYLLVDNAADLARSFTMWAQLKQKFNELGVLCISARLPAGDVADLDAKVAFLKKVASFVSLQQSKNIRAGLLRKVQQGGMRFRAPLGYLPTTTYDNGVKTTSVVVDADRAPHIRFAFTTVADGTHTLAELRHELQERGLTTRPTSRVPAKALTEQALRSLLRRSFYAGLVQYQGDVYNGAHEPLVDMKTFERVQTCLDNKDVVPRGSQS